MKEMFKFSVLVLMLTVAVTQKTIAQKKWEAVAIGSPNGAVRFKLNAQNGALTYSVNFRGKPVIEPSSLGFIINDKEVASHGAIGKTIQSKANKTYASRGVHSLAHISYNSASVVVSPDATLEFRAYDNGVAFRYIIKNTAPAVIQKELTSFTIPAGYPIWSQGDIGAYEGKYNKKNAEDFKKGQLIGPPATIEIPNKVGYAAITEGGLTDFAGMSLIADTNRAFRANLTGLTNKIGAITTPWRIIELGRDLNTLVNCDIVADVSPEPDAKLFPQGYATDWVKPGRSVWSWLAVKRSITLENIKHFTDLAAELGFEYNLVDEGWGKWKDSTRDNMAMLKELVDYSTPKGIKIWVWKAYPDRAGIPGLKDSTARKAFFEQCKKIGIAGLKIDFFDAEGQDVIDFYQAALRDAARLHLMLDFHGADKPTGQSRTWPNEMTREGIHGLEQQPPWAPGNTTLPFTRYLAGPADFTPLHFGNRLGEVSWAQQIASMVIFTSPFLCVGADPQSILDNPCRDIIKSIPPTWDETVVLRPSEIGKLALYARRKGDTWFIAGLTSSPQATSITVTLPFYLKKGKYQLTSIKDNPQKQADAILETSILTAHGQEAGYKKGKTSLKINFNAAGGYVGVLKAVK